jgi:hypothetical protein
VSKQYSEYIKDYPAALAVIADCLNHSHLPRLENIALRFSHALDEKTLDLKDGHEREFLIAVLVKTVNEMFAAIGSLQHGALLASYHHARSIFELFASLEHVYSKPSKQERRLEKFHEYPKVAKYLHCRERQRQLPPSTVSKEQFAQGCHVTESQIEEWKRIWRLGSNDDLQKIRNWHHPATIENLFESSCETKEVFKDYVMVCHATHLSPLGNRVAGGHFLIGFPKREEGFNYVTINRPIDYTIIAAQRIAISLHGRVNASLIQGVLEWVPGD